MMPTVSMSERMGHEADSIAEPVPHRQVVREGMVMQVVEFAAGRLQLYFAIGELATGQGHDRDPPSDDRVDGGRPLQPFGGRCGTAGT